MDNKNSISDSQVIAKTHIIMPGIEPLTVHSIKTLIYHLPL